MTTTTTAPPTTSVPDAAPEHAATPPPPRRRTRRVLLGAGATVALLLLAVIAVAVVQSSGGRATNPSTADERGSDSSGGSASLAQPAPSAAADRSGSGSTSVSLQQRQVVSTGTVALSARDVNDVRQDVDRLLARYDGRVAEENTDTDTRGRPTYSRLTLRVPTEHFDDVMTALAGTGRLRSADRSSTDVTTRVIDVQQRIKAQEAGLTRLRALLGSSSSLSSLLQVEQDITRREGELDSLKQQRSYLADQTSLSTITLSVDRIATRPAPPAVEHAGFLTGLERGWTSLVTLLRGLSLGLGAALPFLVLLLVLAFPARWYWRRSRRPAPAAG